MKKKLVWILLASMMLSVAGCGGSKDSTESSQVEVTGEGSYGEVNLGEYKGLSAEKEVITIEDSDVDLEIENLLEENQQYNPQERGAKTDDYVEFYFTASINGEVIYDYSDELYYIFLGEEELGEDFDANIEGKKAGEKVEFSVTYPEDNYDENLAGNTVDFAVTIDSVNEVVTPDLDDDFIVNTLGYESEEDMRAKIKENLEADADAEGLESVKTSLMEQVIANSEIVSYSDELYQGFLEDTKNNYQQTAEMFGFETVEELYEAYGMSEADVEEAALQSVYEVIVVEAIANAEGIEVSDDEFQEKAAVYAQEDEYESVDDYITDNGEDSIRMWILMEKVYDFLVENANITEVEAADDDSYEVDEEGNLIEDEDSDDTSDDASDAGDEEE